MYRKKCLGCKEKPYDHKDLLVVITLNINLIKVDELQLITISMEILYTPFYDMEQEKDNTKIWHSHFIGLI